MSSSSRAGENASQVELELYFIIAKFLGAGPCQEASKVLLEELEHHQLLPKRIDWEGREHFRSYDNLVSLYKHIKNDHLLRICQRLPPLLEREVKPSVGGVMSLLGAGSLSALRTEEDVKHIRWKSEIHSTLRHQRPLMPPANLAHPPHLAHVLEGRSLCGQQRTDHAMPSRMFSRMSQLSRSLGHLSAVYCLCFDRTGDYFFTGADDHLIKVWSTTSGRLIATLRGHSAEITDMAVNHDNSMLAAGSCDKLVRVWCLGSMAPLAVLHSHSGMVTSLQFCPYQRGVTRYLASTGGDGCVCFWKWNVQTKVFDPKPIKFIERSRAGAQMLCSSFSPGGVFLTTGNSDHVVRVYCLSGPLIEKICELESHTDQVDSIQYANHCSRFVSGSKDGCARVWRYERQEWRCLVLDTNKTLQNGLMVPCDDELQLLTKRRVTMVCWNADDTRLITAVSDCTLKVWDSSTGELLQILKSHQDEVFVLEHCPTDPRIILSAGHDGHIILWDISDGHLIKKYFNNIQGQGHGAVFDCKWAPDGQSFSATDSHGFIMYFGFGSNERFQQLPEEMFFHTDYRPLVRDGNNYVLDEQTQQPPHLMPPPFLVDIDGNPHPPRYQRLVPGRERCDENQLVPQLAMLPNGDREVLDDVPQVAVAQILGPFDLPAPPEAPPASEEAPPPSDAGPASEEGPPSPAPPSPAPPSPAPPSPAPAVSPEVEYDENGDVRIIDRMIEHLQQEQDQRIAAAGGQPLLSPRIREGPMSPLSPPPIRAPRRSREVEGVRQPQGPVPVSQQATDRDLARSSQRVIVRPLGVGLLRSNMRWTAHMSDSESKAFTTERKRKPLVSEFDLSDSSASGSVVRRKKGRNEERTVNRLTARALYDTEEEETPGGTTEEIEEEEAVAAEEAMDNMWKSSSDGESSDYSDWMEDAGHNLQPPQRRSTRKPKRRRFSSEDDSDADSTDTDADDTPRSDVSDDDEPSTSRRTTAKKKAPPKRKKAAAKQTHKERKQQQKKQKLLKMQGPVTELPEQFKPPEWLTENVPKKSPYFPQMGDEVMYFRQGHELYLKAVKHRKVYDVDIARNQPWHKISHLREMELVKVIGLKYEIKPPRLVCLKLALIDTETGGLCPGRFTVKYHDMPDVIDFIVLKQTFDSAKQRKWKVSDHFRSLIDDAWWFGQIEAQTPLDEHYPDSLFQCFTVHWANGEIEKMSPWDLEPCSEEAMPRHRDASVPVTQAERESMLYVPNESDWPEAGREEECRRISQAFGRIMELSIAEHFLAPVDLNAFPTYAIIVAYPVDLTLIKERLDKHFFRRINSIQYDVRHIESNAVLFNEPTSRIVKLAKQVTELCLRVINDSDCYDPMPLYNEITKEAEFSLHPVVTERKRVRESNASSEELDVAGPSITAGTSRNPSKRRRIDVSQGTGAWKAQCRQLLDIIYDCDDSAVFRNPVSAVDYPDYYEIITSPMDLSTVKEHLQCGHYDTPGSFAKDVKLVFNNSKQYNTNKRSRIYAMTLRLGAMFDDQIKDIITNWKSSMKLRRTNRRTKASVKGSSKSRSTTSKMAVSPGPSSASASTPGSAGSRAHSRAGHSSTGLSTSGGSSGPRRPKRAARAAARQRMVDSDHDDEDEDASGDESTPQPSRWSTRRTQKRRPIFRDDEEEDLLEEEDLDEDGRPRERPKSPKVEDDSDSDYHMSTSRRSKPTPRKQPSPAATVAKSTKVKRVLNKPPSKKKKLSNGQRSYSTRCSTGSLQRKNYKRVFSEETSEHHASDEDEDDNDEEDNSSATSEEEDTNVVSKRPPLLRKNRSQGKATSGKSRAGGKRAVSSESEDNEEEEHEDSEDHDSDKTEDLEEVVVARKSRTRGLPPVNGNNHDHSSEAEREEKSDSEEDADSDSSVDNTKRQSKVETDDSATEIENNDDDDEDEDDEEMAPPKPTRSTRSSGRSRQRHASSDEEMEYDSRYSTRNRGQRTVLYREESDDNEGNSDEEPRSVSSRGRVRKITPRARGIFS